MFYNKSTQSLSHFVLIAIRLL